MSHLCNAEAAETDAEKKYKNEFFSAISACSAVKDWIERLVNHGITMIAKNVGTWGEGKMRSPRLSPLARHVRHLPQLIGLQIENRLGARAAVEILVVNYGDFS